MDTQGGISGCGYGMLRWNGGLLEGQAAGCRGTPVQPRERRYLGGASSLLEEHNGRSCFGGSVWPESGVKKDLMDTMGVYEPESQEHTEWRVSTGCEGQVCYWGNLWELQAVLREK